MYYMERKFGMKAADKKRLTKALLLRYTLKLQGYPYQCGVLLTKTI